MSDNKDLSRDLLMKTIKEIVKNADLNVMSLKMVRNEIQTRLQVSNLNSRKKEINEIIMEVINGLNKTNDSKEVKTTNSSLNETNVKSQIHSQKSFDSEKDIKKESSDESSSDGSDEDICDEELARKLQQKEVLDAKQRVTRSNKSNTTKRKSTKDSSNKKKRNNTSDSEDKGSKKRKNGYLKPCLLSPLLGDFLGESEMPRHEVVKRIWSYVKEKNLLDPKNKQYAICDNELLKIFGNRKRFRLFGMMKHLTKHLN